MSYSFVSGATGGIGRAFSVVLAERGCDLFLTGRSIEKLEELKQDLLFVNDKIKVEIFPCDLTSENSRAEMIDYIDKKGIKFDRICNVAGVDTQKAFLEYSEQKLLFQLRVNVEGTVAITHALLNRRDSQMEIVTISSMSGVSPMPYFAVYSATKALLTNLFTSLHYELKKKGVKVTVVLPGGVPTRPDVIAAIEEQGVWGKISSKSPRFIAEKSLKVVKRNKIKYIPGFFNKFLNFIMKIAPKKITLAFIAKRWEKLRKDAF